MFLVRLIYCFHSDPEQLYSKQSVRELGVIRIIVFFTL